MPAVLNLARAQWLLAATTLVLALLLGGGQGTPGDGVCQLFAIALLGTVYWRHGADPGARLPRAAWWVVLPLALPLLQLLPVPEGLWLMSPAREVIAAQFASVDVPVAHRLGLVPTAIERALVWMLPMAALFLAALQSPLRQRYRLVVLVLVIATAAMLLGALQLGGGIGSPLRFYRITNFVSAVGFFANSNHNASFLAMAIPLALVGSAAWARQRLDDERSPWLPWSVGGVVLVLLILGIAMARSRAGMGLGALALVLSVPAVLALHRQPGTRRALAAVVAVGLALSVQFAMFGILQRIEQGVVDETRLRYSDLTFELARQYAPMGTGLGGFRRAFEAFDTASPMGGAYINHAHNDVAELWLEAGWPGALVLGALVLAFLRAGWTAWRDTDASRQEQALRRAAWIALLLVLLHSFVDYPLRTTTHLALLGLLAAFLTPAPRRVRRSLPDPPATA